MIIPALNQEVNIKVCSLCNCNKSNTEFASTSNRSNGYGLHCRSCRKISKTKEQVSKAEAEKYLVEQEMLGNLYECKDCSKEMTATNFYYKRDYGKVYVNYTRCRKCTVARQRFKAFGITEEDYNTLLEDQQGLCGICEIPMTEYIKTSQNNKVFAVDHCHSSGKIRGLLCCKCNRGLGYFKDCHISLLKAIDYIGTKRS